MKGILDEVEKEDGAKMIEDSFAAAKMLVFLFFTILNITLWCIINNENSLLGVLFVIFYYIRALFLVFCSCFLLILFLKTGIIINNFLKMNFVHKGIKRLSLLLSFLNIATIFNIVLFILIIIEGLTM